MADPFAIQPCAYGTERIPGLTDDFVDLAALPILAAAFPEGVPVWAAAIIATGVGMHIPTEVLCAGTPVIPEPWTWTDFIPAPPLVWPPGLTLKVMQYLYLAGWNTLCQCKQPSLPAPEELGCATVIPGLTAIPSPLMLYTPETFAHFELDWTYTGYPLPVPCQIDCGIQGATPAGAPRAWFSFRWDVSMGNSGTWITSGDASFTDAYAGGFRVGIAAQPGPGVGSWHYCVRVAFNQVFAKEPTPPSVTNITTALADVGNTVLTSVNVGQIPPGLTAYHFGTPFDIAESGTHDLEAGCIGVLVASTGFPSSIDKDRAEVPAFYNVGWLSFADAHGSEPRTKIDKEHQLLFGVRPFEHTLEWNLYGSTTATVTPLLAN